MKFLPLILVLSLAACSANKPMPGSSSEASQPDTTQSETKRYKKRPYDY